MENNNKIDNKVVQTYAEDMAKAISSDQNGLIKKIIHEDEQHEIEKKNLSPESKKNKFFITLGFLFIALGFAILFYFFIKKDTPTVEVAPQFSPIIFHDKSFFPEVKDFTKDQIAATVFEEVNNAKVKAGGVEGIYLTSDKKVIPLRQFMTLIKASFTADVLSSNRLSVDDNFLMGVVNGDTKDFFMLLKVNSVLDVFNSLHTWERKMLLDLHGFFGFDLNADNGYLLNSSFEDGIIENKNARILYDKDHNTILMYVFADDNSVIITNTNSAAREIILRLAASQVKK